MTERQEHILEKLIEAHVKTGEPVSSKYLEKLRDFDVSSATLRNEMNDLAEAGYLAQPYTSAGRVPTEKAYRYFVDKLMKERDAKPTPAWKKKIDSTLETPSRDPWQLNKTLAQTMSELSDSAVMAKVLEGSAEGEPRLWRDDFFKTGLSSLFEFPEFQEFDRAFQMTNVFDHFEEMFSRIERMMLGDMDRMFRVFIGHENPLRGARGETMIVTRYPLPGRYTGSMTLIGPMRMDYERNIGLMKYMTKQLNQLFG